MLRSQFQLLCILVMSLVLVSCRQPESNPELKDPIYKDLKARADSYEKSLAEAKKKIEELKVTLEKAEPNSIDLKNVEKELAKAQKLKLGDEQLARYYGIRSERRKIVGRIAYRRAFDKLEEWPDPKEYAEYQVNIRLHEINLNWNSRVPRLQDRTPASLKAKAKTNSSAEPRKE